MLKIHQHDYVVKSVDRIPDVFVVQYFYDIKKIQICSLEEMFVQFTHIY